MQKLKQALPLLLILFAIHSYQKGIAQVEVTSTVNQQTITFDAFSGSGFDPNPSSGQLNSYSWSVLGLSDGDLLFGESGTSGDYARGSSTGGVTTGGIYSFDNGTTGSMLGFQPTGSDLTPGDIRLKVQNSTGDTIYGLELGYYVWEYNDADRSNSVTLAYSTDSTSYTNLTTLNYQTDETAEASPSWDGGKRDTLLSSIKLEPNDSMYLKWTTNDMSGSGSRDEIGIDNITLRGLGSVTADLGFSPNDTVCEGSLVDYIDSSEVQNDSITGWVWDFDNGDTSHAQNPTYDHSNPGTYNIQLVVSTEGGLKDTATKTLEVLETDDPSFHYDTTSYCDQETDPTPTITGDAGGTFSEGTGDLSIDASTGTIDLSASVPGTYTVFYETDSTNRCPDASTFELEVVSQYDATIDSIGKLCSSNDTVIDLKSPHEGGTWSGTGVVNDSTGGFNPNVAGVDTHEVVHEIGGACGDSDTINIVVDSTVDATIDSAGPYCLPSVTDVLSAADGGGVWSGPGIIDSTNGEFSPNDAGEGTHTIVYEIDGGCYDIDSIDIQVDSSKDATIDPAGPYCEKTDTVNLTAADTGGVWKGNGIVDTSKGLFLPSAAGVGTHTVVYEIEGNCGDIDSESIKIYESKDGSIDSTGPYCILDDADTLTAADTNGTWSGPGIIDSTEGVFHPDSAGAGNHEIVHAYPNDSCAISDTMMIEVLGVPDPTIDSVGALCLEGDTVQLTAADSGGTWSGPGIVDAQKGLFDPSSADTGTHTIEYSVQRIGACDSVDSTEVTVVTGPTADFGWSNSGLTVSFSDSSSGHTGQNWEFGDGDSDSAPDPTHTYDKDSIYNACLYVFDSTGCTDTICKDIDLRDVSIAAFQKGENAGFEIRPNPSSERVEIQLSTEIRSQNPRRIELVDLNGRTLRSKELEAGEKRNFDWDVSDLEAAPYLIRVVTKEGSSQRKLMVR